MLTNNKLGITIFSPVPTGSARFRAKVQSIAYYKTSNHCGLM